MVASDNHFHPMILQQYEPLFLFFYLQVPWEVRVTQGFTLELSVTSVDAFEFYPIWHPVKAIFASVDWELHPLKCLVDDLQEV